MNKVQTIILKFVVMMSFIAMVFSFCKIDADAMDWGPTNSNRYLIQNLGSNADILDIVEYLDANWFYGIKLCETPYSAACSSCLSLQGTDQSIKNKIEEHMRPGKNGGMNCTGLVGYVYRQKGADLTKITQIRKGWYINATNWHNTASGQGGIANAARTYRYNTIQEMLSAKKAIKGDLIFFEPKNWYASGTDCHIGFYWGNYPGHDQFLHNSTHPNRGAQITTVTPKCDSYVYVIKSAPSRITFDKNTTDTVTNMPANGKKYMNSPFIFPNQIPKREGYTFKGWDRDKNNTSGVFPGFEWWIEDENQTVYAIWEKNKNYNVKYVVDGDKQFTKTMEQEVDKNYTVLSLTDIASTAAKTGYTFSNWECNYYASESNISTKTYNPGDTYKNLSSPGTTATFTSKWKANKYTIKYNANGGSGTMSSQSATYDQNVTLNQNKFTKTGYTFLGWSEDSSATTPTYTDRQTVKNLSATNGATVNLYAVWHKNAVSTYLIRFNANGGSGYMSNMTCEVGKGYYLTKNAFTKSGYTFKGWATISGSSTVRYTDQEYISDLTTTNGAAITLYAVWESNTKNYTIRFNSNGGYGSMSDMTCTVGSTYQLTRNAFYKNGYSFVGWNTYSGATSVKYSDGEFVTDLSTTNGSVVNLYAVWKEDAKSYTIRFNANYGSGSMSDMTCVVGYSYRLSTNQFTRSGYIFKGWSLSSGSYNSVNYTENAYVTDLSTTNGATVNLYAVWEKQADSTYTIRFNSNGGSGYMSNMTCSMNTYYNLSANTFTRSGFSFAGWSLGSGNNNSVNWSDKAQVKNISSAGGTVTLYAVWKQVGSDTTSRAYTIIFSANGGTGTMANQKVTSEPVTLNKNQFTKDGYEFAGWKYLPDGKIYPDQASVTWGTDKNLWSDGTTYNNVVVYAQWKQKRTATYTIRFDANGGSGYMNDISATCGSSTVLPTNQFTRTDYTFKGWSTTSGNYNSVRYTDGATVPSLSSTDGAIITLYAVWEKNATKTYTVYFNGNGATSGYMSYITKNQDEYFALPKNQFTRSGYTFQGWALSSTGSKTYNDEEVVSNLASVGSYTTLYAVWKQNAQTYTIHFNANGGYGSMDDMTCKTDEYVTLDQNAFYRDNYTFKGWATYSSGSVEYQDEARVYNLSTTNGDTVTLYAVWEKKTVPYSVIYRWNDQNSLSETKQYNMDTTYNFLTLQTSSLGNIEKPGYSFYRWYQLVSDTTSGWITSDWLYTYYQPGASFKNLTTTENGIVTLYGEWTANNYKIRFNANGGSGSMSDQSATYDQDVTLSANKFKRDGYKFVGWATSSYGYKKYDDEQTVRNLTTANGSIVTLYAVWEQTSQYTIRFDANGGKGSMSDMTCYYGVDVTLPKHTFTKDKTDFAGWSLDKNATNPTYGEQATVRDLTSTNNGIVTLYAVWNDIPGVDVDDIYIFKDEKDKVTTEFVEAESNLRIKKNNSETNVLEYHNTNIDDIKADLDADKDETTVKFDVIYNTGYETTATCKLYVIDIVHKDSALARVRYIDDAQYISESSVWSNSTMNTILRNALGVKENMDDIPSTEVEKADTTS